MKQKTQGVLFASTILIIIVLNVSIYVSFIKKNDVLLKEYTKLLEYSRSLDNKNKQVLKIINELKAENFKLESQVSDFKTELKEINQSIAEMDDQYTEEFSLIRVYLYKNRSFHNQKRQIDGISTLSTDGVDVSIVKVP